MTPHSHHHCHRRPHRQPHCHRRPRPPHCHRRPHCHVIVMMTTMPSGRFIRLGSFWWKRDGVGEPDLPLQVIFHQIQSIGLDGSSSIQPQFFHLRTQVWIKVKSLFPKRAFFQTPISTSWPSAAAGCLCQVRPNPSNLVSNFFTFTQVFL